MHRLAFATALALLPTAASAGDASLYTLTENASGFRVTATLNGLPIGPPGYPAESLVYALDEFLRPGDNALAVTLDRTGDQGSAGITVLGPSPNAFGIGGEPQLFQYVCESIAHDAIPACPAHQVLHATLRRADAPDLRAWHAEPPPAGTDPDIAIPAALARLTAELAGAARAGDWDRLYYLDPLRRADILRANPAAATDAATMARYMAQAAAGMPVTAAPPAAEALAIQPLGNALWSVTRHDGGPILDIAVTRNPGGDDPDAVGDVTDRYLGGRVERRVAVFGLFAGQWHLIR